jgi:hypothetical protein
MSLYLILAPSRTRIQTERKPRIRTSLHNRGQDTDRNRDMDTDMDRDMDTGADTVNEVLTFPQCHTRNREILFNYSLSLQNHFLRKS